MPKRLWHEIVNEEVITKKVNDFVKDLLESNFALANLSVRFTRDGQQTRFKTTVDGGPTLRKAEIKSDDGPTIH